MLPHAYQTTDADAHQREAEPDWRPDDLIELLSEAAVAIANLDSPQNPVALRLRARLRLMETTNGEL